MKKCSVCGTEKELTDFYKNHRNPDGMTAHCKSCQKEKDTLPQNRFSRFRADARKYEIPFTLTLEQYKLICAKPCHYCDSPIPEMSGRGVDRVDRTEGYTAENLVPCCWLCNHVKGTTFTEEEMKVIGAMFAGFNKRRAAKGLGPLEPPMAGKNRTPKYWITKFNKRKWDYLHAGADSV